MPAPKDLTKRKLWQERIAKALIGNKYRLGKKHSKERKKQISEFMKGNQYRKGLKLSKGHIEALRKANIGRKISEKTRKRMSKAQKGKIITLEQRKQSALTLKKKYARGEITVWNKGKKFPEYSGDNSSNWKGGVTPYTQYFIKELRHKIKERDNFTCQECGISQNDYGQPLCVHHKNFNKKDDSINNLITVCSSCHAKLHELGGVIEKF